MCRTDNLAALAHICHRSRRHSYSAQFSRSNEQRTLDHSLRCRGLDFVTATGQILMAVHTGHPVTFGPHRNGASAALSGPMARGRHGFHPSPTTLAPVLGVHPGTRGPHRRQPEVSPGTICWKLPRTTSHLDAGANRPASWHRGGAGLSTPGSGRATLGGGPQRDDSVPGMPNAGELHSQEPPPIHDDSDRLLRICPAAMKRKGRCPNFRTRPLTW